MADGKKREHKGNGSEPQDPYQEYRQARYASHVAERRNLDDLAFKTSERYDQWVLTLAGGALAISLTFLEKIAPQPKHSTLFLLGLSWLAFILAILAGFAAIYCSRKAIYRAIEIYDEVYREFSKSTTEDKPEGDPPPVLENRFSACVQVLNRISLSCLGGGTVLMCVFALINLASTKVPLVAESSKGVPVVVNLLPVSSNTVNITPGNYEHERK